MGFRQDALPHIDRGRPVLRAHPPGRGATRRQHGAPRLQLDRDGCHQRDSRRVRGRTRLAHPPRPRSRATPWPGAHMTTSGPAQRLHHVTFAVSPERLDEATQFFTELGFSLQAGELPDAGLHLRLDWERGIELISPVSGSTAAVAASVNEFLNTTGDGVYTVVLQVPGASAAES